MPAIEAATAATSGSGSKCGRAHRFVWSLAAGLVDVLDPQPGERILDVGCGTGQLTELIARNGRWWADYRRLRIMAVRP